MPVSVFAGIRGHLNDKLLKKGMQQTAGTPAEGQKSQRVSSGVGEVTDYLRTSEEGSVPSALCFAGVDTSLPDIPRPVLRSDVTELNGIYPAELKTSSSPSHDTSSLFLPCCASHS